MSGSRVNHVHFTCIFHMGVSENGGTPKSSILIGFFIINHPFWGTPIFGNTRMFFFGDPGRLHWFGGQGEHDYLITESLRKGACGWDGNL